MRIKTLLGLAVAAVVVAFFVVPDNATKEVASVIKRTKLRSGDKLEESPKFKSGDTKAKVGVVTLNAKNTYIFRGAVSNETVAKAQMGLMKLSRNLSRDSVIYLVLDTPGGSIQAGNTLVDTIRGLPQKVKTITQFAASMGFYFVQALDERIITPSGVLMAHRAKVGGVSGEVPGEAVVRINMIMDIVREMEKVNALRIGVTLEDYQRVSRDEYWVSGEEAVRQGVADRVAAIACDESLDGINNVVENTIFGQVQVQFSNCPAIMAPLAVNTVPHAGLSPREEESFRQLVNDRFLRRGLATPSSEGH